MAYLKTTSPCLELAIEGERLCRAGELKDGISCFQSALSCGTNDLRCRSAIYCQLGNAYFCRQDYAEALYFHGQDLTLAWRTGDAVNEAQASGNLGNTLKMLGKYDDSIICFNRQLDLSRQLEDKQLEARALYNLGNVFHAKGKQWARQTGQSDPGEFPTEAAEAQRKALDYYSKNLHLVRELGDRPAEGRVYGNLGNTHYLLGHFHKAVECHQERLNFATEFGDLAAQRRAYSNLGNAYIYLADFSSAANNYRHALRLAQQLNAVELEAQACYSLGNTFTLLREPIKAVVYYLRHLVIARRLGDRVGEGRAHWSLANTYTTLERYDLALRCARRHRLIAQELHDDTGSMTAQLMIREIQNLTSRTMSEGCARYAVPPVDNSTGSVATAAGSGACPARNGLVPSDSSIGTIGASGRMPASNTGDGVDDEVDLYADTELDAVLEQELSAQADELLDTVELVRLSEDGRTTTTKRLGFLDVPENMSTSVAEGKRDDMCTFYSAAPSFQRHSTQRIPMSDRNTEDLEDQLESIGPGPGQINRPGSARNGDTVSSSSLATGQPATDEEQAEDQQEFFFSLLLNSQARRMDEQRCCLNEGTTVTATNASSNGVRAMDSASSRMGSVNVVCPSSSSSVPLHLDQVSEEAFFDLIEGVQGDRMDDQRASLPVFPGIRPGPGLSLFGTSPTSCGTSTSNTITTTLHSRNNLTRASTGSSGASDGLPEPIPASAHQRAFHSNRSSAATSSSTAAARDLDDEFLDMILRLQSSTRINDQRSNLPDPLSRAHTVDESATQSGSVAPITSSVTRSLSDTNRFTHSDTSTSSVMRTTNGNAVGITTSGTGGSFPRPSAPTVPDEDFFALIQRVQSTRLDEQRCNPPAAVTQPPVSDSSTDSNRTPAPGTEDTVQRSSSSSSSASSTTAVGTITTNKSSGQSSGSRRRVGSWRRLSSNPNR